MKNMFNVLILTVIPGLVVLRHVQFGSLNKVGETEYNFKAISISATERRLSEFPCLQTLDPAEQINSKRLNVLS